MNGLQRTMLGTLMAGVATFGVGNAMTGKNMRMVNATDTIRIPHDTVYVPTQYEICSNPAKDYYSVVINDTVYFNKKEPIKVEIPKLTNLVEEARKPAMEFLENGLKLLRKIR